MKDQEKKLLSDVRFSPEKEQALLDRIDFVHKLLDPIFTDKEKEEIKKQYLENTGCTQRTIRNYLTRYKENGTVGLILFERKKERKPLCSSELEDEVVSLIKENPKRSIPKIRELLLKNDAFTDEASRISERQFYRIAGVNGLDRKGRTLLLGDVKRSYRSFEAPYSMALVQGDARDGIWLDCPDGRKRKTYLFGWCDDYSRKILHAQYYFDEKLPRMEDSFRKMVLKYGLPEKLYLDNGSVYISNQFRFVVHDLGIKKTHHPAFKAFCKGKVESVMKKIKNDFQSEAQHAGFKNLEELNTALWAWIFVKYDRMALSTTGEAPGIRFIRGLTKEPKRIQDLDEFMQYFLIRDTRTVNKYGQIKAKGNIYPVKTSISGKVVNIRYDPFDLTKIFIYNDKGILVETTEATKLKNSQDLDLPEESKEPNSKVQQSARNYFEKLRKLRLEAEKKSMPNLNYEKLFPKEEKK